MKTLFFFLLLFALPAHAEDARKPVWLLAGPEAYHSSLFRNSDWSLRPAGELHVPLQGGFTLTISASYYEFRFADDDVARFSFGPGLAYDLIPERLRFSLRTFLTDTSYRSYDDVVVLGAGVRLQYFVPIHEPWRLFFGLGFDLVQRAPLRHDLTPDKDQKAACIFACASSEVEKAGHVYEHITVPGSREFSSQFGVSYAFH